MKHFDIDHEVARLKAITQLRRKKKYVKSRLDKFRPEILALHHEKLTLAEIQLYLSEQHIKCNVSTIHRWLKKNAPPKKPPVESEA